MNELIYYNQEAVTLVVEQLQMLSHEGSWRENLNAVISQTVENASVLMSKLVDAISNPGRCVDERGATAQIINQGGVKRMSHDVEKRDLEPGFYGGAAGFTVMFMMVGQSFEKAIQSTKSFYKQMGWQMIIHIDDHGKESVLKKLTGCGFLKVWHEVVAATHSLLTDQGFDSLADPNEIPDFQSQRELFIERLQQEGALNVILSGKHAAEAHVVINMVEGKTLPNGAMYDEAASFELGLWLTASTKALEAFNNLAGSQFTLQQFEKLQVTMYLTTVALLGGNIDNIVSIESEN